MTSTEPAPAAAPPRWGLAAVGVLGIVVAALIAGYSRVHPGDGDTITTFGFSSLKAMKTWLTTAAMVFAVVQVISALAMWGRLPGVTGSPSWAGPVHRWSGVTAFLLLLPVAFQCVWAFGFSVLDTRNIVHSLGGCLFYGVFASKMLALRIRGLPGWALPLLGGALAVILAIVWFSSAFWYFTRSGAPLT